MEEFIERQPDGETGLVAKFEKLAGQMFRRYWQ